MKKVFKKIIVSLLLVVFVFVSGLITIILFPQPLFANKMEHGNFNVYSNGIISADIGIVLDNASQCVKACELYDEKFKYDLFFSYGTLYNEIDNLMGPFPAARAVDNNVIIKIEADVSKNMATGKRSKVNLTWLIAHEMVHCLQAHKYGKLKFNPWHHPPLWKLEGYPEYVSRKMLRKESYDLSNEIKRFKELQQSSTDGWVEVEPGHFTPAVYYKGRLLVEYLIDIKGYTYNDILQPQIMEDKVDNEMMQWYQSKIKHHIK
jgi:hypothetical protein